MIRLARHGAKKKPFYHIVAIDKRRARNAICTEKLGFYNPLEKYATINIERIKYWISTGAQCSETVTKLVKKYEKGHLQMPQTAKNTAVSTEVVSEKKQPAQAKPVKSQTKKTIKATDKPKKASELKADKKAPQLKEKSDKKPEKTTKSNKTSKKDEQKA